jgi:cytochrome P450
MTTGPMNIADKSFWAHPATERVATWAALRRDAPVSFTTPSNAGLVRSAVGHWAVTRHADVQHVSRHPEIFVSGQGVGLSNVPQDLLELNASFLVMDAPRHTELRRVVSGAFTPRQVSRLESAIKAQANHFVDQFADAGGGDVVTDLAMKLPLWTISHMMGIPEEMQLEFYQAAEAQIAAQDPDFAMEGKTAIQVAVEAATTLHRMAAEMAAIRRSQPADDIWSTLVHSQFAGAPLSDSLLGGIFVLFATAGNDTTRNSTGQGIRFFADDPAQWELLGKDPGLLGGAVEEIVRYATPVIHFRRTAATSTEIGGVRIAEGDAVVMYYESANRDESVFDDAETFDITRRPNPHVGFGGGGVHFCLGANLARAQLRALFGRLVERVESLEVGEPSYLVSNFINGIKRMPVSLTAR